MNNTLYKAVIDDEKCIGCGACIVACRQHAIKMKPGWKSYVVKDCCIGCGRCVALCHRNAPQLVINSCIQD